MLREPEMARLIAPAVLTLVAFGAFAQTPLAADVRQGRLCKALAPADWSFTGENPAGSAFGADIQRADGKALASYYVIGVPAEMRTSPTYAPCNATRRPRRPPDCR